jgi:hypothetical protein
MMINPPLQKDSYQKTANNSMIFYIAYISDFSIRVAV